MPRKAALRRLSGHGEMAERIRAHDWGATPIGALETWPDTLIAATNICLNANFPTAIYWGPELALIYNDAWAPIPAERHPWSLGQRGKDVWPEIWDVIEPQFAKVFETGEGFSAYDQLLLMERGGVPHETYWTYSFTPILGVNGEVLGIFNQGNETTDKVRGLRDRTAETARMRELFQQAPAAIAVLRGPSHVFEIANPAYLALVGRDDILGKPVAEALPETAQQGFIDLLDAVFRTGEPHVGHATPVRLRRNGGMETFILDFVYQPIRDERGAVDGIFVEATDVTERTRAVAALRDSEERFRLVAESAPVMLWMGDAHGKCVYLNAPLREFWGVAEADVPSFNWSGTVHPDDGETLGAPFSEGMRTQSAFNVEARYRRASDGAWRLLHTDAHPRFDANGAFLGMIGVNVDVTDMREAQMALQALNATLEERVLEEVAQRTVAEEQLRHAQKMEAIGKLTGGIAHDFNNMMAVVIGGLNLLQRRIARGETDVSRYVEAAMEGATRASALTQRLLAFSRQQPLAPEPLDANRLVSSMTEMLTRTLGEQIRVETVLLAGVWRTFADPLQLESAILNLSVNARDAMPEGGKLTIETANAYVDEQYAREFEIPEGQYVMLAVTDTGTGMTREVATQAFDPFFTTKGVGQGTGLGLSQVFGFVRQSGGHVKIYTELGVGTTLKIYLPRYYGAEAAPSPKRELTGLPRGHAEEVVLVVEDEERVRNYSVEALKEFGYTVLSAANGAEALSIIEEDKAISLLFTDIVMPGMTGAQLAHAARKKRSALKVLFTTGYTRNAVVHNGVLDPGTQLLAKPFGLDQLALKVRDVLDREN